MTTAYFTFQNIDGCANRDLKGTFVTWGGMAFWIEAAKPQLRAAIEAALKEVDDASAATNRRAHMGNLSRPVRKNSY